MLDPIRERRSYYENHLDEVIKILEDGTRAAQKVAGETLKEVKRAMKINYFEEWNK